jgi:hypothetical protein
LAILQRWRPRGAGEYGEIEYGGLPVLSVCVIPLSSSLIHTKCRCFCNLAIMLSVAVVGVLRWVR